MVSEKWLEVYGYPTECPECGGELDIAGEGYIKGVECVDCDYELMEGV